MSAHEKQFLKLQASEAVVSQAASSIYAAYVTAGRVAEGHEDQWMERAVHDAVRIALLTDRAVRSDDEPA